jgi:integrase/recombinase XerD
VSQRLEAALEGFLQHAAVERGLSARTLEAYQRDLTRFVRFVSGRGVRAPSGLERGHVTDFLTGLGEEGLAPASRARMLVSVRRFTAFLLASGALERNPCEGVDTPRQHRSLPKTLRHDESEALIEAAAGDEPLALRDRAMLEVLYGAGLRVSELVALPRSALDARAGVLRVYGKGRRERLVPVGEPALDAIAHYLEAGRPALARGAKRPAEALFLSRRGAAMTRQNFFARLRRLTCV